MGKLMSKGKKRSFHQELVLNHWMMGAVLTVAAKECQIVIFTCVSERYAFIGEAAVVSL